MGAVYSNIRNYLRFSRDAIVEEEEQTAKELGAAEADPGEMARLVQFRGGENTALRLALLDALCEGTLIIRAIEMGRTYYIAVAPSGGVWTRWRHAFWGWFDNPGYNPALDITKTPATVASDDPFDDGE